MASPTSPSRILELSTIISQSTTKISTYLSATNLPHPSFSEDAPLTILPEGTSAPEIEEARIAAVEASIELQQLLQGVDALLTPDINMTSLRAISHYRIAQKVPISGSISFLDLAELTGLYEHDLRRIIRYAISHHRVFKEVRKGIVAHSAASRRLAESERLQHVVGMTFDEVWPAEVKTVDALIQFNKNQAPNATGFALANNTNLTFYEFLSQHPERAKRFGGAMSSAGTAGLQALADKFAWSSLPAGAQVLDLGGSQGHVSAFLAESFPDLKFTVQDLPEVIADTKSTYKIPTEVKDRVRLMGHDFFEPQPLKDIDVVLIRYCFHNWSDEYCARILKNLIPGLKAGSKIVIQDHLMPEPNTLPLLKERGIRSMDLIMLTLFNARERDGDDWKGLVEQADEKFRFESATRQAVDSPSGVMVVTWTG
ncbi:putative O-methyltransferase [Halenospora varia]|nr:putative O-methyltransferase [Halenospora varia]